MTRDFGIDTVNGQGFYVLSDRGGDRIERVQLGATPEENGTRRRVLVLGAGTGKKGPGPLVTQLTKNAGTLPIPITIVPGDLSKEKLESIT